MSQAGSGQSGYLSNTDWNTFNNKQSTITKGNLTGSAPLIVTNGTNSIIGSGVTVSMSQAGSGQSGYLSNTDWNTFNNKQSTITKGNLTGSAPLTVTNGTNSIIGSGVTVSMSQAGTASAGWLSASDWNVFNQKGGQVVTGSLTSSSPLIITGDGLVVGSATAISMTQADSTHNGYLSASDWNVFNQKSGQVITGSLTGSSPLTITGGGLIVGSATTISMSQAGSGQSGYLSNTDWNTFNNKFTLPSGITISSSGISSTADFSLTTTGTKSISINSTNAVNIETDADSGIINIGTVNSKVTNIGNTNSGICNINGNVYLRWLYAIDSSSIHMLSNVEINNNIFYKYDNVNDLASSSSRIKRGYITTVYSTTIDTTTINKTGGDLTIETTTSGNIVLSPYSNVNSKSVLPSTTNTYNLGSSSYYWNNGYITTLNTTQIINSSQNSNLVQQTTSGDIVFNPVNGCVRPYTTNTYNLGSSSYYWNNGYITTLNTTQIINSSQNSNLLQQTTSGDIVFNPVNGCVRPYTNNTYDLGTSSFSWRGLNVNNIYDNNLYTNYIKRDNTGDLTIETTNGSLNLACTGGCVYLKGAQTYSYNLHPYASNTYDLGTSSKRWNDCYVNTLDVGTGLFMNNKKIQVEWISTATYEQRTDTLYNYNDYACFVGGFVSSADNSVHSAVILKNIDSGFWKLYAIGCAGVCVVAIPIEMARISNYSNLLVYYGV
jgi:hypothetical protein